MEPENDGFQREKTPFTGADFQMPSEKLQGCIPFKANPQQGIRNKALCELSTPMSNLHPEAGIITYPEDLCTV